MSDRSLTSLACLLLTQRLVEGDALPLRASEYWPLLDRVGDPARLLGLDVAGLAAAGGVDRAHAERITKLFDAATAVALELDRVEQSGLRVLASVDDGYPPGLVERLGSTAPPLLCVAGDPRLLRVDLLGVVGARDVDADAAQVARGAGFEAARRRFGVVSGFAKGVDRLAMGAAIEAGTSATGILAESLTRAVQDADVRRSVAAGDLCLCTPYKPTTGFSVGNAMGRNKLIYALSAGTLVVAADAEKGGTWAGAVEALRHETAPVLVWVGAGARSGNARLVDEGATPLDSLDVLFPLPERPAGSERRRVSQLALDL